MDSQTHVRYDDMHTFAHLSTYIAYKFSVASVFMNAWDLLASDQCIHTLYKCLATDENVCISFICCYCFFTHFQ